MCADSCFRVFRSRICLQRGSVRSGCCCVCVRTRKLFHFVKFIAILPSPRMLQSKCLRSNWSRNALLFCIYILVWYAENFERNTKCAYILLRIQVMCDASLWFEDVCLLEGSVHFASLRISPSLWRRYHVHPLSNRSNSSHHVGSLWSPLYTTPHEPGRGNPWCRNRTTRLMQGCKSFK